MGDHFIAPLSAFTLPQCSIRTMVSIISCRIHRDVAADTHGSAHFAQVWCSDSLVRHQMQAHSHLHSTHILCRVVATLGSKSSLKKVTRKAILDVDVQKACDTIVAPEAPMALRLQSNLLSVPSSNVCGSQLTQMQVRCITRVCSAMRIRFERCGDCEEPHAFNVAACERKHP